MKEKELLEKSTLETSIHFHDGTINAFINHELFSIDKKTKWNTVPHNHAFFELHYIMEGETDVVCYSEKEESRSIHLETDNIMILAPFVYHYTKAQKANCYRIGFHFYFSDEMNSKYKRLLDESGGYIVLTDTEKIVQILRNLYNDNEYYSGEYGNEYLKAQLLLLFIELFLHMNTAGKGMEKKPDQTQSSVSTRKYSIESFLRKSLDRKVTLSDLANELFLSEKQTARFLKKEYGKNFAKILVEYRIFNAKVLLVNDPKLSVARVAEQVGFQSQVGFINAFKKFVNKTPTEYRKAFLRNQSHEIER